MVFYNFLEKNSLKSSFRTISLSVAIFFYHCQNSKLEANLCAEGYHIILQIFCFLYPQKGLHQISLFVDRQWLRIIVISVTFLWNTFFFFFFYRKSIFLVVNRILGNVGPLWNVQKQNSCKLVGIASTYLPIWFLCLIYDNYDIKYYGRFVYWFQNYIFLKAFYIE